MQRGTQRRHQRLDPQTRASRRAGSGEGGGDADHADASVHPGKPSPGAALPVATRALSLGNSYKFADAPSMPISKTAIDGRIPCAGSAGEEGEDCSQ
jgi:hypothetical protein